MSKAEREVEWCLSMLQHFLIRTDIIFEEGRGFGILNGWMEVFIFLEEGDTHDQDMRG